MSTQARRRSASRAPADQEGPHSQPLSWHPGSVAGVDLEALTVLRDGGVTFRSGLQRPEPTQRTAERVAADVVKRPHVLLLEAQMRLWHQGLSVGAHEAEIDHRIGVIPAMVAFLPFTASAEAAHGGSGATLIFGRESHLVGPAAAFRAVGVHLAVHLIAAEVLADQARNHAAPAAVWVDVADVLVEGDVLLARYRQLGMP